MGGSIGSYENQCKCSLITRCPYGRIGQDGSAEDTAVSQV